MKTPNSTIFYVVHHTLGPRHFLVIFKHYEEGFQRCNYRLRSIHFLFQSQSFFSTCGSLCCSFPLRSSYRLAQPFSCTLHLCWLVSYAFLWASLFLPLTEQSALQTGLAGYFLPSLRKPICFKSLVIIFLCVNDLPTDPWPHQVPHFFLFSDGDTLWSLFQLKRINTKVFISSQDLSILTNRTLLNFTNSIKPSPHSLQSPRSFFPHVTLNHFPDSAISSVLS